MVCNRYMLFFFLFSEQMSNDTSSQILFRLQHTFTCSFYAKYSTAVQTCIEDLTDIITPGYKRMVLACF